MDKVGELTLPGVTRSVRMARRFVRDMMPEGYGRCDDLQLCVSETVSNAILHTDSGQDGWVTVRMVLGAALVRVEVVDDGGGEKEAHVCRGADGEHGRGLLLVEETADRWGVDGRNVWCEFDDSVRPVT
ncbi:ATP-binding protein [Actinocorallia longicatena]|uniref:ATP-binding protein n=1 Tax=Actinocorallia longicatena TaxID=111803 RepID=A0ABP6Q917_9ACTN